MNQLSKGLTSSILALTAVGAIAPPSLAGFFHNGWHYAIDVGYDSIAGDLNNPGTVNYGGTIYEMFGLAIKENTTTNEIWVGLNANLPLTGRTVPTVLNGYPVPDGNIGWGDMFFDFTGAGDLESAFNTNQMYGVRFSPNNDSGALEAGLYQGVRGASVSSSNAGYGNFTIHNNAVTGSGGHPNAWVGDLRHNDSYFTNGANNQIANVIAAGSGTKVADVTIRNRDDLENEGFDLSQFFGEGDNIFGFSFPKQVDMVGNFIATIIEECINDAMSLLGSMSSNTTPNPDISEDDNTGSDTSGLLVGDFNTKGQITEDNNCAVTHNQLKALAPDAVDGDWKLFYDVQSNQWYDPPAYTGFEFEGLDGTHFHQIPDFPCGISANNRYAIQVTDPNTSELVTIRNLSPGDSFDFVERFGQAVSSFKIFGHFDNRDAENNLFDRPPFMLPAVLSQEVGNIRIRTITDERVSAPEPGTMLAFAFTLGMAAKLRRKR